MAPEITDTQMTSDEDRVKLPGFGLPLTELPVWSQRIEEMERFPHAIVDQLASDGVTVRERRMLEFVNQITDKPEWDRKVFDETIVGKWRDEASQRQEDIDDVFLSEQMFKYCIEELREKAERFKEINVIPILDAETTIVKSDTLVSSELDAALRENVKPLEDVPDHKKDWHPHSGQLVLDLLHPSLCPLIYGTTRILPYGTVPLRECAEHSCEGEVISTFDDIEDVEVELNGWGNTATLPAWGSFQWLPTDVKFNSNGKASITSYINNLHPVKHAKLYPVLEKFVDCAIPLWDEALSWFFDRTRIKLESTSDEDFFMPEGLHYDGASGHSSGSDFFYDDDDYRDWKEDNRVLKHPEPEAFKPWKQKVEEAPFGAFATDLRKKFADSGLQVIFKLANIHLTPESPEYDGSSWHVEGALNEHICATALYYYDQDNITDSHLYFRQSIDAESMTMKPAQSEYSSLEAYYNVQQEGPAIQELGKVLTRQGRMLAFPNVMQHRVGKFELQDKTKPGHRKILAMFLIDPHIRIISTANVGPQQKEWWAEEVRKIGSFAELPVEVFDLVIDAVEGYPLSYEEACEVREKLMDERGAMNSGLDDAWESETFFFCEH